MTADITPVDAPNEDTLESANVSADTLFAENRSLLQCLVNKGFPGADETAYPADHLFYPLYLKGSEYREARCHPTLSTRSLLSVVKTMICHNKAWVSEAEMDKTCDDTDYAVKKTHKNNKEIWQPWNERQLSELVREKLVETQDDKYTLTENAVGLLNRFVRSNDDFYRFKTPKA